MSNRIFRYICLEKDGLCRKKVGRNSAKILCMSPVWAFPWVLFLVSGGLSAQVPELSQKILSGEITEKELRERFSEGFTEEEFRSRLAGGGEKKGPGIEIENAAEGEFLRGQEDPRGLMYLRGRIRIKLPDGTVTADTVIIDTDREEFFAEGNLKYTSTSGKYSEFGADRLLYNNKLKSGIMYNAEGYHEPVLVMGESMQMTGEGRYSVSHAYFTSNAAKRPHYHFTARKLWLYDNNKIAAVGVLYYVGGVPLIPLPFLYASEWGTGIISQIGYSTMQGMYWQNTYQFSNPAAHLSMWQPVAYRFTADYYAKTGEVAGAEFYKMHPNIDYFVQLGLARYRRYEFTGDPRKDSFITTTNDVVRPDGTIGKDYERWYKAFSVVNLKSSDPQKNSVRNVHLRFEDYADRLYEFEFGSRYQPVSTIPALYSHSESGRGFIRDTTQWNLVWNEQRDDLSVRVEASQNRIWYRKTDDRESEYVPQSAVIPAIDIKKNIYLGTLESLPLSFYWDNSLHSSLNKTYSYGDEFRTLNNNSFESGIRTFWSFYPYISVRPVLGYGVQEVNLRDGDQAVNRDAEYNSYQYLYTRDEVVIGPDVLNLRAEYRRKQSFKEDRKYSPVFNYSGYNPSVKENETHVSLNAYPIQDVFFSVRSVYDHKTYEEDIPESRRWKYPVFTSEIYFDVLNPFKQKRENLLSRRKLHFMGVRFTNDYVYDPVNSRDHSNVAGVTFEAGGFDLWLLERLRYFEAGFYWYHVYYNRELDHMRYSVKADVQLTRNWYLEMEMESRTTDTSRYLKNSKDETGQSDYRSFDHDVLWSTGIAGPQKRMDSVFNIGYFEGALVLDLYDWEFRFGYSMEQRSLLGGVNSYETVNFYDNRFFFSATLLRFDFEGIGSRPSKYTVNRQRVRPADIGRLPFEAGSIRQ